MESSTLNIFLGFIEGFGLIISPCILPIVPIFLASALSGSRRRLLGMIVGFTLLFALVIFFSRQLTVYLDINFTLLRTVSYVILGMLGIIMFSSYLTEKFSRLTQKLSVTGTIFSAQNMAQGGFFQGIFLGCLIAIIWTPCAGPILAAVIVQTVAQKTTLSTFLILLAFALGAVLPLFIISLYGKKIINAFKFFKIHAVLFRKLLGAIIIFSVFYMIYSEGKVSTTSATTGIKTSTTLIDGLWRPYSAPQLAGIDAWINSQPLQINALKGKVVLIDFWTYSCINCLRSLPYVKAWYEKYRNKGFVVIGVHTPEFPFEKNLANVKAAVQRNQITYPVALDNQFLTWTNFENHYWPAHYLINKKGEVVYQHFGEGDYEITENNIRFLLGINELAALHKSPNVSWSLAQTPETYLGYERADPNFSPELIKDKPFQYHWPAQFIKNAWGLNGWWQVTADSIIALKAQAALKIHFQARKVFMVMGNTTHNPIKVEVWLNGIRKKEIIVDKYSIYEVVTQEEPDSSYLELRITAAGVRVYTFTFGN